MGSPERHHLNGTEHSAIGIEYCAAGILKRRSDGALLLIRTRAKHFELPKGHIEPGETEPAAAARELCEETGLLAVPPAFTSLGALSYRFDGTPPRHKRVASYLFEADDADIDFGSVPRGTRERRWVHRDEIATLPLRSENLRPLLLKASAPAALAPASAASDQPG